MVLYSEFTYGYQFSEETNGLKICFLIPEIFNKYKRSIVFKRSVARTKMPRKYNLTLLRSTAAEIRSEGGQSWVYQCDVSNREEVKIMAQKVRKEVGDVNILVNNAGIMITKQFLEQTDSEVESTINVSVLNTLNIMS